MNENVLANNAVPGMNKAAIEEQLRKLAPFHHAVALPYGLSTYVPEASRQERERTRLQSLIDHLWPPLLELCGGSLRGHRVLDVACNCGGFSVEAAKSGADYVFGFDVEDHYIKQADFIKDVLGLTNAEFSNISIDDLDVGKHGTYDVTFCFGILYHLENPIRDMKMISSLTKKIMVVNTTVMHIPYVSPLVKWPLWHMRIVPPAEKSATNISTARWRKQDHCQFSPNVPAVKQLLKFLGFNDVRQIKPQAKGLEERYYKGSRVTFIGIRS